MRWLGSIACAATAIACARGPNVASGELPLRRVVVYRNGVGYFERSGTVSEERVKFEMRQRMVGDFLASLAVIERGGSSVRSASFPIEVEDQHEPEAEPEPEPIPLYTASGDLVSLPRPPKAPQKKKPDPNAMREVLLHLDGKQHELAIGYLSETPVWRPSYRVVVAPDGKADLQAWGIVQNLSGEDWNDVALSLVAGAPLAFQSTLGTPVVPQRPVVTDQGEVVAVVPTGVTSLDQSAPPEPAPASEAPAAAQADLDESAPAEAEAREEAKADRQMSIGAAGSLRTTAKRAGRAAPGDPMAGNAAPAPKPVAQAPMPAKPQLSVSAPRRLSDLAAVALEAGTTRYDIPYPVTVPNESATMVLLTSQRVPGEAVLLYAPEPGIFDSSAHPFRVARFKNSTPGLLERGPIAVFERASFLGQGMLEPLPPRATATVPFALDRSVAITNERRTDERGSRLYRIEAGQIFIERDAVELTKYLVNNGGDQAVKLLVQHPRIPGSRLFKPPAETEDNAGTGAALVPVMLRPRAKTELVIDERRANQSSVDWLSPLADNAVRDYLADSRADATLVQKLKEAWTVRDTLRRALDEFQKLSNEKGELERLSDETRRNLRAIEKNPQAADLRQKLTKRLTDATTRIDAITKRTIELKMSIDEQQVRFRDAVQALKLDAPLPVKD